MKRSYRSDIYDLMGNVRKWNEDGPRWWRIREKSLSGGSWLNSAASLLCDAPAAEEVRISGRHIGFRVVVGLGLAKELLSGR